MSLIPPPEDDTNHLLTVDEQRIMPRVDTGIYVRALNKRTGQWLSVDISELDRSSLVRWLGGGPLLAQHVVLLLLNHPPDP